MRNKVTRLLKGWGRKPIEVVARVGYAANGLMYVAVGLLALQAALRGRGDVGVDRREALLYILTGPFGRLLLAVIALGLVGYAVGHLAMATRDPAREKRKGIPALVNRGAHGFTAIVHFSLALAAFELLFTGFFDPGNLPDDWTARVMEHSSGRWLIAASGLVVLGYAIYALYRAYSASFIKAFVRPLNESQQQRGVVTGKIGYAARAIVYALIGSFLIRAAWFRDPREAGGLGDALATLAEQQFGPYLLGAVAAGLIAFGLYGIFLSRYRDLNL
ncbi:MAG: DUF1206 domain-containing protein [Candidatus Promineifilaceae bacterium]|nr:DUF1206 domain-containing protein [Candidatus Promineifilaceae bacterium]